jgi:hypothetical protein
MFKALLVLSLCALFTVASVAKDSGPETGHYVDLTGEFARFVDDTAGMEEPARIALFRQKMDALLPGFYTPRFGATPEKYDAQVAGALKNFAAIRPKYEEVQRTFPAAFDAGLRHFRKQFPGFTPNVPVYLLHSLGEMDGGTRDLNGKTYLIFGADVIAQIHDAHDLTPFLDHELFHVENHKAFPECEEAWCSLWAEGLATYAAKMMNPGVDDKALLLTLPQPIRANVDATWPAALCFMRARLWSKDEADLEAMFMYSNKPKEYPSRFGYYVGLRVAEELGAHYNLSELAQMPPERVKTVLPAAIDRIIGKAGGCK